MQRGRPRKSWWETVKLDHGTWHFSGNMVFDRGKWQKKLRTAVKVYPSRKGEM